MNNTRASLVNGSVSAPALGETFWSEKRYSANFRWNLFNIVSFFRSYCFSWFARFHNTLSRRILNLYFCLSWNSCDSCQSRYYYSHYSFSLSAASDDNNTTSAECYYALTTHNATNTVRDRQTSRPKDRQTDKQIAHSIDRYIIPD